MPAVFGTIARSRGGRRRSGAWRSRRRCGLVVEQEPVVRLERRGGRGRPRRLPTGLRAMLPSWSSKVPPSENGACPSSRCGSSRPSVNSAVPTPVPRVSTSSKPLPSATAQPCTSASFATLVGTPNCLPTHRRARTRSTSGPGRRRRRRHSCRARKQRCRRRGRRGRARGSRPSHGRARELARSPTSCSTRSSGGQG